MSGVPLGAVGSWKCSSNHAAPNTVMLATTVKAYLGAGGVGSQMAELQAATSPCPEHRNAYPNKTEFLLGEPSAALPGLG